MTGITLGVVGLAVVAFCASQVTGVIARYFVNSALVGLITVFTTTTAIAAHTTTVGSVAFTIVTLSPLLCGLILGILYACVRGPLVKYGYLGKPRQWRYELQDDDEFMAALKLTDEEDQQAAAEVSASAEDFKHHLVQQAGIEDVVSSEGT